MLGGVFPDINASADASRPTQFGLGLGILVMFALFGWRLVRRDLRGRRGRMKARLAFKPLLLLVLDYERRLIILTSCAGLVFLAARFYPEPVNEFVATGFGAAITAAVILLLLIYTLYWVVRRVWELGPMGLLLIVLAVSIAPFRFLHYAFAATILLDVVLWGTLQDGVQPPNVFLIGFAAVLPTLSYLAPKLYRSSVALGFRIIALIIFGSIAGQASSWLIPAISGFTHVVIPVMLLLAFFLANSIADFTSIAFSRYFFRRAAQTTTY